MSMMIATVSSSVNTINAKNKSKESSQFKRGEGPSARSLLSGPKSSDQPAGMFGVGSS